MSGNKFEVHNEEAHEDWLLSYADMITLLMAFFIMMAAISKVDSSLYEKVQSGMAKDIGNRQAERPMENMRQELDQATSNVPGSGDAVDVGTDDRGVVLNLDAGAVFAAGSADINPAVIPLLKELVGTLNQPRFDQYRLEIQGHTDNTPVKTAQFPSNFDLSAARALTIMRTFVGLGVPEAKMIVAAYGQYSPRVPNTTPDGAPLAANQALNRRVAIHVYPRQIN